MSEAGATGVRGFRNAYSRQLLTQTHFCSTMQRPHLPLIHRLLGQIGGKTITSKEKKHDGGLIERAQNSQSHNRNSNMRNDGSRQCNGSSAQTPTLAHTQTYLFPSNTSKKERQ